ncbi:MAG: hypothetical protein E7108_09485 [Bacteroidales bacterium]|nr:hypothetical protein [Bacteroidales bacterium]
MVVIRIVFFAICVFVVVLKLFKHYWKKRNDIRDEEIKSVKDILDNQKNEKEEKEEKEELQFSMQLNNSWVNNCDQKAGMMLVVIGIAVSVIVSGNFINFFRECFFVLFIQSSDKQGCVAFPWDKLTVLYLLLVSIFFLVLSCIYLFRTIRAETDYERMKKIHQGLIRNSHLFFGEISGMSYSDFSSYNVSYVEDLKSQVYVNSKIVTKKFKNYNEGLYWLQFVLLVGLLLFVAIVIMD